MRNQGGERSTMKRRQPYYRESDEKAVNRRKEAIVDRALLYAHLLTVIDQRRDEPEDREVAVEQDREEVGDEDEAETLADSTGPFAIASGIEGACQQAGCDE